jgi:hypothetical protein
LEETAIITLLILGGVDLKESSKGFLFGATFMENFFPIHFIALNFEHIPSSLFASEGASYSTLATGLFCVKDAVTVFCLGEMTQ